VDLYVQHGCFQEHLISITKKGMNGQKEIAEMMESYRNNPPKVLGGVAVKTLLDYELRKGTTLATGEVFDIALPKSNVLQFVLEDGSKVSARPSGTEPKIKFYFSVNAPLDSAANYKEVQAALMARIEAIIKDMNL
jgi:phosphoglucomutase